MDLTLLIWTTGFRCIYGLNPIIADGMTRDEGAQLVETRTFLLPYRA